MGEGKYCRRQTDKNQEDLSLMLDDAAYFPATIMEPRDVNGPTKRPVLSPEEEERQRKQEYVRNTLLEYERQKKLSEERDGVIYANTSSGNQQYTGGVRSDAKEVDFNSNSRLGNHSERAEAAPRQTKYNGENRFESLATHARRGVSNNYIPASQMSQNISSARDREQFPHVPDNAGTGTFPPNSPRLQNQEGRDVVIRDAFIAEDMFVSSAGDEGYGTDSRSNTTASISSPLSSSLSSLTTESCSSLNGSQRGVGGGGGANGLGSARAQPVPSSGRLVMAKRGILVKRRDLPPVERIESVTLEDRLRALTTIEEEESGAAATNAGLPANSSSAPSSSSQSGIPGSNRRPAGSSAVVSGDDSNGGLGLGGVKVNDSGEIEIDYSYYMKATPSESNDEVNTYSPTHPPQELLDGESVYTIVTQALSRLHVLKPVKVIA
nr:hypothetical protein BaRGS_021704 [Batillaria attramentaria]